MTPTSGAGPLFALIVTGRIIPSAHVLSGYFCCVSITATQARTPALRLSVPPLTFSRRALFDGEELPIHLRVAEHAGRLYLDLCDRAWRAVEIDTEGWRVVERSPARFRRTRGSQPLPEP